MTMTMSKAEAFHGEYCFRLGNGDVGGDPAFMVNWLARNGHRRVAVLAPWSPISEEYFRAFRQECRRHGVSIAAVETVNALVEDDELVARMTILRESGADALAWLGYGGMVVSGGCRRALEALDWDQPPA